MVKPSSFATLCTSNCAFELVGLLLSLSIFHTNEKIYIICDTKTKQIIGEITPQPRLQIVWHVELDKYDGMDRQKMEQLGLWSEFQMAKATIIEKALRLERDTLLLDSDIIITDTIDDVDNTKELGVSPHYMKDEIHEKYGFYNGGMLWTKNKKVAGDWIAFTRKSRYFDQASIEDLAKKYKHFEFGENYNLQAWRLTLSSGPIIQNFSSSIGSLQYKNKPIKFIHTHFLDKRFAGFNELIINHLKKAKMYKILAIIYRVLHNKWVLRLPLQPMTGLGKHKNDSYRELPILFMVNNRDVGVVYDESTIHCWIEPNILTYDRPTLQWCNEELLNASLLLLGNGDVNVEGEQIKKLVTVKPWIFWPRKPMLLEKILKIHGTLQYDDRQINSIFIGNIENSVQEKYRNTDVLWQDAISEYHCTSGTEHKFTPEEYLMKLRNSKYGLCLRGYGSKCHREVELMAFGTVPLIADGVSVDSYMEPLIENIHYLKVSSPDEIKTKTDAITYEQWVNMSKSCYEWYQRNVHSKNAWNHMISEILYGETKVSP
jgi:hypothetical protein